MNVNEIIRPEDVMAALNGGFEVFHIRKDTTHKYGTSCRPLTKEVYENIEKIVDGAGNNDIFVKTTMKEPEEDQNPSDE